MTLFLAAGLPECVESQDIHALVGNLSRRVFRFLTGIDSNSPLKLVANICSDYHLAGES